jgi:hypothetical protein
MRHRARFSTWPTGPCGDGGRQKRVYPLHAVKLYQDYMLKAKGWIRF